MPRREGACRQQRKVANDGGTILGVNVCSDGRELNDGPGMHVSSPQGRRRDEGTGRLEIARPERGR